MIDRINNLYASYAKHRLKSIKFNQLREVTRTILKNLGSVAVIIYSAYLYSENKMTLGTFIAFNFYYLEGTHAITTVVKVIMEQKVILMKADKIREVFEEIPLVKEVKQPLSIARTEGNIEFTNVSFSYNNTPVLKNINLVIPQGQKIAIVGPSGSGKSTIFKLLLRFYDPDIGDIKLDGCSLKMLRIEEIRENIGIVFQETFIYNLSFMENIRFGDINASDSQVVEIAKKSNCEEFILASDNKHNTILEPRGANLSSGQRQRIGIARILLKSSPIILLDEATASLDNISEKYFIEQLDISFKNKTIIAIAHRISSVKNFDRIIVLEEGSIVGDGTYEELLNNNKSFNKLISSDKATI